MDNGNGAQVDFSAVLDAIAERVAAKVCAQLEATQPMRPRLLSVGQAAAYLGRTENAVRCLAATGALPSVRADSRVQFDIHDLNRWIDRNKDQR